MLFGDILLSSPTPPSHPVALPAIGSIGTAIGVPREYHPVGLQQKICSINDSLMIAWAGPQFVALSVVRGLREKFSSERVTWKSLDALFKEYGVYNLKDSQFIVLFAEDGNIHSVGIHTFNFTDPVFGECHIGGSGSGKLFLSIERGSAKELIKGAMRDVDSAISSILTLAIEFLLEEFLAGAQETNFGGAFEIGAITQSGAEKVGDVLNLFWVYDRSLSKVPLLHPLLIKQDYSGDDLILQALRLAQTRSDKWEMSEHTVSIVSPLDRTPANERPLLPDLNCRYLCNCYYTFKDTDTVTRTTSLFSSPDKKGPVQFAQASNGQISINYDLEHFHKEWDVMIKVLQQAHGK